MVPLVTQESAACRPMNETGAVLGANQQGLRIHLRGRVQGVGFRPFVWHLARRLGLTGTVCNTNAGVSIEVWGQEQALQRFMQALHNEAPPLAHIDALEQHKLCGQPPAEFVIAPSREHRQTGQLPPDLATCPQCLEEVLDPAERRYQYPFANCTQCGPRFSIAHGLPYDRARTSMAAFPLCPACTREYQAPDDRRFHAQAMACPGCGPRLWLTLGDGSEVATRNPVEHAARRLRAGEILAIKGVGGFHLVVDAGNAQAVARLRRRKRRPHKPLALMARDLDMVRRYRTLDAVEARSLSSPAAPIVLLHRPGPEALPANIAPGLDTLGFMLPPSPLHHLLLRQVERPLVFTSGNVSAHPPCCDNAEALSHLSGIADAFLLHEREIVNRVDDSVLRIIAGAPVPLRRARGLAPTPIALPAGFEQSPAILALGGESKNTFCLLHGAEAVLSPHIGELEHPAVWQDWLHQLQRLGKLFAHQPALLAMDTHPNYHTTLWGQQRAAAIGLPALRTGHHHAHFAACLADNAIALDSGPSLAVVLDGIGHGEDGSLWGGELLLGDYRHCRRLARLKPAALPGGDRAIREPWRNLAARLLVSADLRRLIRPDSPVAALRRLARAPLQTLAGMITHNVNSPHASSSGRLFDAVADLLDLAPARLDHEGQAAMALEAAAARARQAYPCSLAVISDGELDELDPAPLWPTLITALAEGVPRETLALGFHQALAEGWARLTLAAARQHACHRVALSGGVMQNRILCEALAKALQNQGLEVLIHRRVPPNDGGLALGQACIAAARHCP